MHIFALIIFALTSFAAMAVGIGGGYLLIAAFLGSFGRRRQREDGSPTVLHLPATGD